MGRPSKWSPEFREEADKAVERWFEDKGELAVIVGQANEQRTKYLFTVEDVIPHPAPEWGIILGDAVYCLRSALDQLMWECVIGRSAAGGRNFRSVSLRRNGSSTLLGCTGERAKHSFGSSTSRTTEGT